MNPGSRIPFTEAEITDLTAYIDNELEDALQEHDVLLDDMDKWDKAYLAEPKQKRRTFPWPGAANIEIPVLSNTVDSIVARMMNTIFAPEPFWTIRPLSAETDLLAKPLEAQLDWSRKAEFNLYNVCRSNFIELVKYGWSWFKFGWEVYTEPQYTVNEYGIPTYTPRYVRRPNIYHIMNKDVVVQAGMEDEEQAEWLAHVVRLTDNQLHMRDEDGVYEGVEKVLASKDSDPRSPENRSQLQSYKQRLNTLYEIQIDWRWGEPKVPIPMLITYHRPSRTILRAVFNPYGMRCLKKTQFIKREGKLKGMGLAPRLYHIQEEISALHRQQVDNGTLANTRFFVGKKNVVRSGMQIWPGRVFATGNPKEDIIPYQMGDIYQSQGILELRALSYAERASGVSDYQLGRESSVAGSSATATGTLAVIQEGNRRFDLNIRDTREVLGELGRAIILLNQMFRPSGMMYFIQGSGGKWTENALSLPNDFDIGKVAVDVTASTATINRSVERQEIIALVGIQEKYISSIAQLGLMIMNPQMPAEMREFAARSAKAAEHIMKRLMQTFDVKDVEGVVPSLLPEQDGVDESAAEVGGLASGVNGDSSFGRLADISQLYSQFVRGGAG